jgi:D-alanyl-D-alanine carboxypeptidase/D-alanyl-D-alanine-endopeptidase (penicillin-binding protein 4)
MKDFLRELGIGKEEFRMEDGSGLSRLTVVTPGMLTALLRYMYGGKYREQWMSLLPVGGEDGTLEHRFTGRPEAARIHAKTGSLSHVAALSGYAVTRSGQTVAFSVMANNYNGPSSEIRAAIDKIALTVANLE